MGNSVNLQNYKYLLYAYLIMLKQIGAKYSDNTLKTASDDMEKIYLSLFSESVLTENNIEDFANNLFDLKLTILNLQITLYNKQYTDLSPVCTAISVFLEDLNYELTHMGVVSI